MKGEDRARPVSFDIPDGYTKANERGDQKAVRRYASDTKALHQARHPTVLPDPSRPVGLYASYTNLTSRLVQKRSSIVFLAQLLQRRSRCRPTDLGTKPSTQVAQSRSDFLQTPPKTPTSPLSLDQHSTIQRCIDQGQSFEGSSRRQFVVQWSSQPSPTTSQRYPLYVRALDSLLVASAISSFSSPCLCLQLRGAASNLSAATYCIQEESHTLGNALRWMLTKKCV